MLCRDNTPYLGFSSNCQNPNPYLHSWILTLGYLRQHSFRVGASIDHELLITKFRLKLKKVGKITRPFRYDLSQILYNYIEEVTNRFKGLDLVDRVPEELWVEVCDIIQEAVIKTIPMKKKCKKAKWLSEKALQIAVKRRDKRQRRKDILWSPDVKN